MTEAATDAPYRQVLVTLDGSQRSADAVPVGEALARALGVPVSYLTVAMRDTELDAAVDACAAFVPRERLEAVVSADVALTILGAGAAGEGPVLRCLASHGRGALRGHLLGSIAEHVVRHSPEPTVVVGPGFDALAFTSGGEGIERIVACTDGSETSDRAVPWAVHLARALRVDLELVTVRPASTWPAVDSVRPQGDDDTLERLDAADADHVRRLAEAATDGAFAPTWQVLTDDDPATAVVDYAGQRPGTLLAMHTHGRAATGGRRRFGRVTLRVVRGSRTPILLTGPDVGDLHA